MALHEVSHRDPFGREYALAPALQLLRVEVLGVVVMVVAVGVVGVGKREKG